MPRRWRSAGASPACEVVAGRVSRVCTPPRLGATAGMRSRAANSSARAAPLELEAQHPAEACEQFAGTRVPRVGLKAGVVHARTARVASRKRAIFSVLSFW